jgi:hypothetical protein
MRRTGKCLGSAQNYETKPGSQLVPAMPRPDGAHLAHVGVFARHADYKFADFTWQRWPARSKLRRHHSLKGLRCQPIRVSGLNDQPKRIVSLERPRPEHKAQTSSAGQRLRPGFVLSVERELRSRKQVLGNQSRPGPEGRFWIWNISSFISLLYFPSYTQFFAANPEESRAQTFATQVSGFPVLSSR